MNPALTAGRLVAIAVLFTNVEGADGLSAAWQVQPALNGPAASDFDNRVKAYLTLRAKVDNDVPKRQLTNDANKLERTQRRLGELIRNARASAKQGDVFGPGITEGFRTLLKREVKGTEGSMARASMADERATVELKINGGYPANQPLASVPPGVLQAMPPLPKDQDLEYRFVGQHLILLDTRANLIIDFVFNALP